MAYSRTAGRDDALGVRTSVALPANPEHPRLGGYQGMRAARVPASVSLSRPDADATRPGTVFATRVPEGPGADPIEVEVNVPEGLEGAGREVTIPARLPDSVLEDARIDDTARGWHRGKWLPQRDGAPAAVHEQVAAHLGELTARGREASRDFLTPT